MGRFFSSLFRNSLLLVFISILLFSFTQCKIYRAYHEIVNLQKENYSPEGTRVPRLEYVNSIPILHIYGTPEEMGKQYGTILKKQLNSLEELTTELFPKHIIEKYMEIGKTSGKNLPEKFQAELKGMSEASGVEYSKLLAMNMVPKTTCSTLAMWGDATPNGNLIMGRNADYTFKSVNKALGLVVVKHPSEGFATVSVTFLGLLGSFTGINEKGVCFGNMLVYNGHDQTIDANGLPIHLLMQLGAENYNSAKGMSQFLNKQSHMIPNNVMCADKNEAIVVELSQTQFYERKDEKGVLAATNFFSNPDMYDHYEPCDRFTNLMLIAENKYGIFTLNDMKKAMYIARRKNRNLQCVLFEPATGKLYVSINKVPAAKGPFTEFDIKKMLAN